MNGKLEPTNSPYAMAKIAAIEMGNALKSQYGHKIINLMPTNLYGPNDNFDLNSSHVIPGLVVKFYNAIKMEVRILKFGEQVNQKGNFYMLMI